MTDQAALRYRDECISLLEKALSAYHTDVAKALLFCCFKSPEIMDIPDCYGIICDINASDIYLWDYKDLLWKCHDHSTQGSHPKVTSFNIIIERYVNMRKLLVQQIHESSDAFFKKKSERMIGRITALIGKLNTNSYKYNVWGEVLELIQVKFSSYCDKVSTYLPLNDGTLYNKLTGESKRRDPRDYYTVTSSKPTETGI